MEDDICDLIELDFPDTFDLVEKVSDNAYQVVSREYLMGGWAIRLFGKLIWIMYPPFSNITEIEMKANFLLSSLYSEYFETLENSFRELLKKHNFNFHYNYRISLYPPSTKNIEELPFLSPYFLQLSQDNPLLIVTHKIGDSKVRSCILYDVDYFINLFSSESNVAEKFCIKQLLQSWIQFSDNSISEEDASKIANAFVEENIPDGIKGYTIETINVDNPKLNEYSNYQEPSQTDIIRVHSEIATFLNETGVKPGEYEGKDAKELNYLIFDFLYQKLEDQIKRYDESLLLYTYKQVELIEGKRELNRWQSGVNASKRTDYDFIGKTVEDIKKIASVASSAKLIVELILKVNPTGQNRINSDSWSYLQALSNILHENIVICEYIEYDIIPHKLVINDIYEIQDVRGEELFNHEEFYRCKSEISSNISLKYLLNQKKSVKVESDLDSDYFACLDTVNEAFLNEYDVSLRNFTNVLTVLGRIDLFDEIHFPLSIVSEKDIVTKLIQYLNESVDGNELDKILRFISLDFNSYNSDTKLVPTNLLRRKERLNLCPLIHLKSGKYLYGNQMCLASSNLWKNSITSGDFPCIIDQDNEISKALKNIHVYLDKELEKDAGEIAKATLGEKWVETNILNFQRLSKSFPRRPSCGEIDLLAVNEEKKLIFVIDAKNMNKRNRPYDIRHEVDRFLCGEKSYLAKLSRKEIFIIDNIEEVLKYFEIQNFEEWVVKKAFVVNKVYPSAFSNGGVDFILLQDLSSYLTQ
ncbi:hypothetical protein [uncultured Methanolobus sp.]|uniref:hypothetical protein n=1 Tax=uncultured Methanolobus sp. TaxID=218300 RepID=UPI002AAB72AA|nr:hypothetical protein [uncultured Methanolobus sp.]